MTTRIHETDKATIDAVKKIAPSVVSIVISKHVQEAKTAPMPFFNPFNMDPKKGGQESVKVGGGSGFIVHDSGLILTNKHVVHDADAEYTVITYENEEYPAEVVSRDPVNDLAILRIKSDDVLSVHLGDSAQIQLGQTVIAIGNALGLFRNSVSKGIVSGLMRSISASLGSEDQTEQLRGVIQTDVAINQGNSGGPLIDLHGHVIGVNTAVIFGAQNIGFAIPINWVKQDIEDIVKHGRIIKPFIGVQYAMLNKELQKKYDLPVDYGALVMRDHKPGSPQAVISGSPADKAGIKENDIILELNGIQLTEQKDLMDQLQDCTVGDTIKMTILRDGKEKEVETKLEERK